MTALQKAAAETDKRLCRARRERCKPPANPCEVFSIASPSSRGCTTND